MSSLMGGPSTVGGLGPGPLGPRIDLLGFTITMVKTIVFAIIFFIILFQKVASISTKLHSALDICSGYNLPLRKLSYIASFWL